MSQIYHESSISPPSWELLHTHGMARTQSPQLSMDGVGRGGKVKQQHNERFCEICKKIVAAGYWFSIYCIYSINIVKAKN